MNNFRFFVVTLAVCSALQNIPLAFADGPEAAKLSIRYDYLCKPIQSSFKGTSFYSQFLRNAPTMKYTFAKYYQEVDEVLLKYNQENCEQAVKSAANLKTFIEKENKLCKESCSVNVAFYHKNDWWWSRNSNTKLNVNECESICNKYTEEQNTQLASLPPLTDHKPSETGRNEH